MSLWQLGWLNISVYVDGENKTSCSSSAAVEPGSPTSGSDAAPWSRYFIDWFPVNNSNRGASEVKVSGGKCGFQGESTVAKGQRGRSGSEGRNQRPKTFFFQQPGGGSIPLCKRPQKDRKVIKQQFANNSASAYPISHIHSCTNTFSQKTGGVGGCFCLLKMTRMFRCPFI